MCEGLKALYLPPSLSQPLHLSDGTVRGMHQVVDDGIEAMLKTSICKALDVACRVACAQ